MRQLLTASAARILLHFMDQGDIRAERFRCWLSGDPFVWADPDKMQFELEWPPEFGGG